MAWNKWQLASDSYLIIIALQLDSRGLDDQSRRRKFAIDRQYGMSCGNAGCEVGVGHRLIW